MQSEHDPFTQAAQNFAAEIAISDEYTRRAIEHNRHLLEGVFKAGVQLTAETHYLLTQSGSYLARNDMLEEEGRALKDKQLLIGLVAGDTDEGIVDIIRQYRGIPPFTPEDETLIVQTRDDIARQREFMATARRTFIGF